MLSANFFFVTLSEDETLTKKNRNEVLVGRHIWEGQLFVVIDVPLLVFMVI